MRSLVALTTLFVLAMLCGCGTDTPTPARDQNAQGGASTPARNQTVQGGASTPAGNQTTQGGASTPVGNQTVQGGGSSSSSPNVSEFPVERDKVYGEGGKDVTPPLTALDTEAIQRALDFWKPVKSGESYCLRFVRRSKDPSCPNTGRAVIQLRQVSIKVAPSQISEADKLNGIEWQGRVELQFGAGRSYLLEGLPGGRLGGGYEKPRPPDTKWSDWQPAGTLAPMDLKRVNGQWKTETSGMFPDPPSIIRGRIGSGTFGAGGHDDTYKR